MYYELMYNIDILIEYLASPEGLNKVIIGIIVVCFINAIFITYGVRTTFWRAKKERQRLKIQQANIDKLSPK